MMKLPPKLVIIVPSFNEEEVLKISAKALKGVVDQLVQQEQISSESYICFVDDGSSDRTWEIICSLNQEESTWRGIKLSKNFGHQSALLAALHEIDADIYVSIDCDLQDDELKIIDMVEAYHEGAQIVYGVRDARKTDTFFKREMALMFYWFMHLLGTHSVYNHADYRLMGRQAVMELRKFKESNVFLRGLVTELGFKTATVFYDRKKRELGESKYPFHKSLKLAWNGITSFSNIPLKIASLSGIATCMVSLLVLIYCLYSWFSHNAVLGWTSILSTIAFFSGLQMLLLGLVGEYIGKIFIESKRRPLYIVEKDIC